MKKLTITTLLIATILGVTSCGSATQSEPAPTETRTLSPTEVLADPTSLPIEMTPQIIGPIIGTAVQSGTSLPGDSGPQVIPVESVTPGPTNTPIPTPEGSGGIVGQALLGPICPVQCEDDPCPDQPYPTTITVQDAGGNVVAMISTDVQGVFRIDLPAGTYTLIPQNPTDSPFPVAGPQQVSVQDGLYTTVVVSYDTGIR